MAKKSIFDEIEGEIAEEVAENAESGAQVANEPDESQAGPDKEEKIGEGAPAAGASPEDPSDEVSDSQVEDYLYGKKGKKKGGKKRALFNEDDGNTDDDGEGEGSDDDGEGDDNTDTDDNDDNGDDTPAGDDCRNRKGKKGKGKKKSHPKNIFDEIEGELSEEVADDPENASAIDKPEENDVKPDEADDDRPNAGSAEAGTTPEEPSEEVSDSQIEDLLGCSGRKKRSKKRKGVRNEDDADDDDNGDDNPENPDDADNQASEEHPDDDDPDNEGDDNGDDDDEGASEDKKKKGKKKSKKGLTNWEAWRAELEEANPTIPEGTDGDRPDGFEQQDDEAKPNTPPELTEPIQKETETSQDDQPGQDPDDLERVPDAEIQNLLHRGW